MACTFLTKDNENSCDYTNACDWSLRTRGGLCLVLPKYLSGVVVSLTSCHGHKTVAPFSLSSSLSLCLVVLMLSVC
jgi:hypothetical protein